MWYSGNTRAGSGIGILVDNELTDRVVEVSCKSDHIMSIKLVVGTEAVNVMCAYALQVGLANDIEKVCLEELEKVVQGLPRNE